MEDKLTDLISDNAGVSGAAITAFVAIIIFVLTSVVKFILDWRNKRATRKRMVIGLFQEVSYNLDQLERSLGNSPDHPQIHIMKNQIETLRNKVKTEPFFRPIMIREETTQFYDAIIASLPEISPSCLITLSKFYAKLKRQQEIVAAFESLAFVTITPDGRAFVVDQLLEASIQAKEEGQKALSQLKRSYGQRFYRRSWFAAFK